MVRNVFLLFICAIAAAGQTGLPDPIFDRVPFEEWLKGGGDGHIKFSVAIRPASLGAHQRMGVVFSIHIDGEEFVKRTGPGQMFVFIEVRDRDNTVFRTHRGVSYEELKNPGTVAFVNFDQYAFVLPGEYQLATAVFDTASQEHSLKKTKVRVPDLPRDPLADAWRNLPEVEYVTLGEPPDAWFFPEISSRLYLPIKNERPVRVDVVVNESPTELMTGKVGRTMKRNMGNLIPALKVLSQMEIQNGSLNVTLLDLERRKVSFTQEQAAKLDWPRLRAALLDNDPNRIDVHDLENHEQNAQFFVTEIRKRLEKTESKGEEPARALIVLSGPMAFPKGQDLRPIEAAPGVRVFYVRYNPPAPNPGRGLMIGPGPRGRGTGPPMGQIPVGGSAAREDSLAHTLKPLAPRLFDVTTPMEFRAALAAMISEISQLK